MQGKSHEIVREGLGVSQKSGGMPLVVTFGVESSARDEVCGVEEDEEPGNGATLLDDKPAADADGLVGLQENP